MYLMVCTATPGLDVLDLVVTVVVVTGMFSSYFQLQFSKIKMLRNLKDHNFIISSRSILYVWLPIFRAILRSENEKISIITSRIDLIIVGASERPH